MKIDKHISELLYEHNCVIVPNFGGFVSNYASAKIHPTQHIFTPPSKNIVFNKNLKTNDGLLANHIASAENNPQPLKGGEAVNTGYLDAINTINQFVSSTNTRLKKGEKVTIEEVGILHLDVERNIQFVPATTNYLLDAFGLTQFQSPAIKRANIGKRIEKEFKDRDAIPSEKKKINIKRYVTIAILIPFIFGIIWIPLKTDLLKNINYSNLNPFASKEITKNVIVKKATSVEVKVSKPAPVLIKNDTVNTLLNITTASTQPVTATVIDNKTTENIKADTTKVATNDINNINDLQFHLITGCFQIEQNAINFVTTLKNQNLPASIIGKRNGLYVVSCGNYATRKDALDNLNQLRINQPNAWLLKN
jgi:cell division septation protein DedD